MFLKDLRKLVRLYQRYDNEENRTQVQKYMADMTEMLKVIRNEPGSEKSDSESLPFTLIHIHIVLQNYLRHFAMR